MRVWRGRGGRGEGLCEGKGRRVSEERKVTVRCAPVRRGKASLQCTSTVILLSVPAALPKREGEAAPPSSASIRGHLDPLQRAQSRSDGGARVEKVVCRRVQTREREWRGGERTIATDPEERGEGRAGAVDVALPLLVGRVCWSGTAARRHLCYCYWRRTRGNVKSWRGATRRRRRSGLA